MRRSRLTLVTMTLLLATPAAVGTPAAAGATVIAAGGVISETSAITQYADLVNTIGITQFPATFTGAVLTNATTVSVYTVADNAGVLTALHALPAHGAHLAMHVVPHSYRQLDDLAQRIGVDGAIPGLTLADISSVAIDPTRGRLLVTLARPAGTVTAAQIASKVDTARARLDAHYGADWVAVADTTQPMHTPLATRDNDSSPWTSGDSINLSAGGTCSLGFTTIGNKSGNDFLLAAGHCGSGTVFQASNQATIGTVSSVYFGGSSENDFETIRANGRGRVWYNGDGTTGNYTVAGSTIPAVNTSMTVDGGQNPPQHTGLNVLNSSTYITETVTGVGTFRIGPVVVVSTSACIPGDSGGPAYVRLGSTGSVNAVGTITASSGSECDVFHIGKELSTANLSLVTA